MVYLSVVIPAYNEESRLPKTLDLILKYFETKDYNFEILVVDDGSSDKTVDIVKEYSNKNSSIKLEQNPTNQGKGAAVRRGFLNANGKYILFSDADLSAPIEEVEKLLHFLENEDYDIAIGSRNFPDDNVKVVAKFNRKFMGRVFHLLVQSLILPNFYDTQCGFKLFKNEVGKKLFNLQKLDGFSFDVEVLYLAQKLGYKVKEVAINWVHVDNSRISLIADPVKMFFELLKIKKLHRNIKSVA